MILKYSTVQEVQMENPMHYLGVRSIAQKRGEVVLRNMKINLYVKSSDLTNLCQLREIMLGHQQLELKAHQ